MNAENKVEYMENNNENMLFKELEEGSIYGGFDLKYSLDYDDKVEFKIKSEDSKKEVIILASMDGKRIELNQVDIDSRDVSGDFLRDKEWKRFLVRFIKCMGLFKSDYDSSSIGFYITGEDGYPFVTDEQYDGYVQDVAHWIIEGKL